MQVLQTISPESVSGLLKISNKSDKWQWHQNFFDIFVFLLLSLVIGSSITSMLAGTGVMTIFVNK